MWKARLSELEFDERELSEALDTLDSAWITAGPRTQAFEKAFAGLIGTAEAVAVSNGTAALFLALKALGVGPGDEVLVPSMTFVATAAAVMHCGATPVLVDICSLDNPTMDPEQAQRLRLLRSHGMTVTSWDREKGRPAQYDVLEFGFNFRFDDIRAALGLAQLAKLPLFNQKRAELVRRYNERFAETKLGVILPFASLPESKQPSYHIYPVVFESATERDAIAELLKQ